MLPMALPLVTVVVGRRVEGRACRVRTTQPTDQMAEVGPFTHPIRTPLYHDKIMWFLQPSCIVPGVSPVLPGRPGARGALLG